MKSKDRYQQCLDIVFALGPFTLKAVLDLKQSQPATTPHYCEACGNKRIRYLCQVTDRQGEICYFGRDCWTKLYNRQFREKPHGST